jgi:hypothetical protein
MVRFPPPRSSPGPDPSASKRQHGDDCRFVVLVRRAQPFLIACLSYVERFLVFYKNVIADFSGRTQRHFHLVAFAIVDQFSAIFCAFFRS